MDRHVAVALLETVILSDVMKVVTANDDGALHLSLHDHATKNASTDGNIAGERALFVDVVAIDSLKPNRPISVSIYDVIF